MLRNILSSLLLTVAAITLALLSGCGEGIKPVKSASKQIANAKRAIEDAKTWQAKGDYDMALNSLKSAEDEIKDGKKSASALDSKSLKVLQADVDDLEIALKNQKADQKKPEEKKVVAETEDPAEVAKREEDAKKKKKDAEAEKKKLELEKQLAVAPKATAAPKKDEDDTGVAAKTGADDKTKADNQGSDKPPPPPEKIGPFPLVTADSPALAVVKVIGRGQYALAYFQIYNKGDKGRRIMNIAVFFKDKDNQKLIAENSVIIFPFKGFSDAKKDLTQQNVDGFTMGAYAVDGDASMQFVAVGEGQRAADARRAGVLVVYDDGTRASDSGPANPTNDKTDDLNLKLK